MTNIINKIKLYVTAHKVISLIIFLVILYGGYWGYKKMTSTAGETRYVTTKVEKGTIVASVSGTGQVSDINQVDLKAKASGDIVYLGAKNGDKVGTGTLILELDPKDAQKAVRDAQANLESTKLSLEKLKIQDSEENLNADFIKGYDDGFNAVSNAFLDLPSIMTGLDDTLGLDNLSDNAARTNGKTAQDYRGKAVTSYYNADASFQISRKNFRILNNNSPRQDIENIIEKTYETTRLVSDAIKNTVDFTDFMAEGSKNSASFTTTQNTLSTYAGTINNHLSFLLAAGTNIKDNKDSAENGALDIQNAELSVTQKENALQDANDKLSDYFIRAPFDGTVANLDAKKSDEISSGALVASIVTAKQLALISLNEVDVAKIKTGEKATLTFDAVPDLTIAGIVSEIDPIGVVSQGVVTYDVKINFDTQDERVKPSMSVSAAVITDTKQDILIVPNSSVKSQNGASYVEMFNSPLPAPTDGLIGSLSKTAPNRISVEVGLSNDSQTEIISGLKEGDEVVSRTILGTTTATTTAPSLFGSTGGNRGTTGSVRVPTR